MPSVSEPGYFCTNGMSESRHDSPFANSGLVVTIDPAETGSSHPLAGRPLPAADRAAGLSRRRAILRRPDPVGPRLPPGPAEPGQASLELLPGRDRRHRPEHLPSRGGRARPWCAACPSWTGGSTGSSSRRPRSPARRLAAARPSGSSAIRRTGKAPESTASTPAAKGRVRRRNHQRGGRRAAHGPGDRRDLRHPGVILPDSWRLGRPGSSGSQSA